MTSTASQIRQQFIDFFAGKHGHTPVPSSLVVPHDDPTLLFTNAGMNQFKDVFLGQGRRDYLRAVDSQKCIRAGGKHNDLEDVGKDSYHHTFFEMLGNWSFGDYFKAEAIEWAWDLLTNVWGLEKDRLHVTVFEGNADDGLEPDVEAEDLWKQFVAPERISRWGRKDNFWEMGAVGPCGPCSEIHYDFTPDRSGAALVNADSPDVIEIWNLVFIQFNRADNGVLTPLPAQHVDTGMGFERIVRVLQGKASNYDTDVWMPIFHAIETHTGAHPYQGRMDDPIDVAYRVIADHIRCLTVAITDGARPGNEGRGYVLRRILRRAVRHAHQTLNTRGAWLHELVSAVVETLGDAFPELTIRPERVAGIVHNEEEAFLRTLDRGIALFDEAAGRSETAAVRTIAAGDAFKLHDTFGFPVDLTRVMAEERGMTVDEAGYDALMEEARIRSRRTGDEDARVDLPPDAIARLRFLNVQPTEDVDKYHGRPLTARVGAIWNGTDFDESAHAGAEVAVILDRTNHYGEAGGQVGDRGRMVVDVFDLGTGPTRGFSGTNPKGDLQFDVQDTHIIGDYVLHLGRVVIGRLEVGDQVEITVDRDRRRLILANHTVTHLLNHALREVLSEEQVDQKGSLVADDRLRFDFSSGHAMTDEQVACVEALVNEKIDEDLTVHAMIVPLEDAKKIHGLRAVFGEQYPDPVRVVSIGTPVPDLLANPANVDWRNNSVEFCGGTHLLTTSEARRFVITQEQALASGVRRIIGLTGPAAMAADLAGRDLESRAEAAAGLSDADLVPVYDELTRLVDSLTISAVTRHRVRTGLSTLLDRVKALQKKALGEARTGVVDQARTIAERAEGAIIVESIEGADKDTLLSAVDVIRAKRPEIAALLFGADTDAGKVAMIAIVPPDLIGRGLKAGDWVREAAKVCGGGGGGRPDMAQAGGKDPGRVNDAIAAATSFARQALAN